MRHKIAHRKLGRTSTHRKALLTNLSISLIEYGKIETTLPKAKELKSHLEKIITKARVGDFNAHRFVFSKLQNKEATKKLLSEIAPRFKEKNGGYLSIKKTRIRRGDATMLASLEILEN